MNIHEGRVKAYIYLHSYLVELQSLVFCLNFHSHGYFMFASVESSGETVQMNCLL